MTALEAYGYHRFMTEAVWARCDLCGADDASALETRARWGQRARTVVCRRCGLVYTNPRPATAALDVFYREHVHPQYVDGAGRFADYLLASSREQARGTFDFAARAGIRFAGAEVLEIGCGLGDFLVLARQAGASILGVELPGPYADFARDRQAVPVVDGRVETLAFDHTFDVVVMLHVLEHVEEPAALMRGLHRLLRPQGRLLIEVPNFMGPWRIPLGEFLRVEHLFNFSPATLDHLLAATGFAVETRDRDPYLLRRVATARSTPDDATNLAALASHHAAVRHHVLTWRLRAWLFRPYFALRRRFAVGPSAVPPP